MFTSRYVSLVMDEVHIKDDLVYDKHEGALVGFVNLGDTNNHLLQFEAALLGDSVPCPLAKFMLVLMVPGLFSKVYFPYAQFACSKLSGDLLMDPVWEAISRLERQGIRVALCALFFLYQTHRIFSRLSRTACGIASGSFG